MTDSPRDIFPPPRSGVERADWPGRAGAQLLDSVIGGAPVTVLGLVTGGFRLHSHSGHIFSHVATWYVVVGLVVGWGYGLVTQCRHGSHNGQTLGKQMLGIKVVRADGRPYGVVTFVVRDIICKSLLWWARFVPGLSLPFFLVNLLDDLWPLWDGENRALHDFVARTYVIWP